MVVLCALRNKEIDKEIDKNIKQIEQIKEESKKRLKIIKRWLSKTGHKQKLEYKLKCFIKTHINLVNDINKYFSEKPYLSKENIIDYTYVKRFEISETSSVIVRDVHQWQQIIYMLIFIGKNIVI
jgi:hypothetical protein